MRDLTKAPEADAGDLGGSAKSFLGYAVSAGLAATAVGLGIKFIAKPASGAADNIAGDGEASDPWSGW